MVRKVRKFHEVIDLLADDLMSEVILFSTQVAKHNISIQLHTGEAYLKGSMTGCYCWLVSRFYYCAEDVVMKGPV